MKTLIRIAAITILLSGFAPPIISAPSEEATVMATEESGPTAGIASEPAIQSGSLILNKNPPPQATRLIFIHHSTGENLLADPNPDNPLGGGLGIALRDNRYFVSDTNYDWGPDSIGSLTDIGHWWLWFRGSKSSTYLNALYAESEQHASYSRLPTNPGGPNTIILFKSCFPNSALQGQPSDPVPPIANNPLKGQDSGSEYHTVANAKGIYNDILNYFRSRQDKLFIALAAPPLTDPTYAANARAFNQWLSRDWLKNYPYHNVAVFDFYNILTTNGGSPDINDLNRTTGNHHRLYGGVYEHKTDGDNDSNPNVLEYPSGDDHPSQAGNLKATAEFFPLLNIYYHCWKGTGGCPSYAPSDLYARAISTAKTVLSWHDNSTDEIGFAIERKLGGCNTNASWARITNAPTNAVSYTNTGLTAATTYAYRIYAYNASGRSGYSDCVSAKTGLAGTPNAPIGLIASATGVSKIALSWTDQSTNETAFRVYRKVGSGVWSLRTSLGADVKSYVDEAATGNATTTTYSYYLTVCNGSGCAPGTATATVPYAPNTLTAVANGAGRIHLGWKDKSNNETGFIIYRKAGNCSAASTWTTVATTGAGVVSFDNTGLTSGQTYAYYIRALARSPDQPFANGYSLSSNCASSTAP